jgi:hypothetical protein
MNKIFLLILISIVTISCGSKSDAGKASFKLTLGNLTAANASNFPGGLLIAGHRLDDSQSFTLAFTDGLVLELQKGTWEFATVGWTMAANGPMTGPQKCSYQLVEVRDDNQAITFNMNEANCRTAVANDGKQFTDSLFYKLTNSSGTVGFKKLQVGFCSNIGTNQICTPETGTPIVQSLRISIPANLKGISVGAALPLVSNCISVSTVSGTLTQTILTLPYGGKTGFLRTDISLFSSSDCSGVPNKIIYDHGLAEPIIGVSNMSFSNTYNGDHINYHGNWADNSNPTTGHIGDTFFKLMYGNYIYLSATDSDWHVIPLSFSDGRPYIDDDYTYLYIKI